MSTSASTLTSGSQKLASIVGSIACMTTARSAAVQRYKPSPPRLCAMRSIPLMASPLKTSAPIWSAA